MQQATLVMLLFIYGLSLFPLCVCVCSVVGFVLLSDLGELPSLAIVLLRKRCSCLCSVSLSRGALGWSDVSL